MKIMSLNTGSSSLKFSLFEMDTNELIASGYFEKVTLPGSFFNIKYNGEKIYEEIDMPTHTIAVNVMLERLISLHIVESLEEIKAVGHRIVQGADRFDKSVLIDDKVIADIAELAPLAPLHNPGHILGINAMKEALPNVPMVAVFDTAFHQTMKPEEYMYAVPYEWYTDYSVRKYGAHGTSYCYISKQIPRLLGKDNYKAIVCHLGSGGSLAAIENGKCVDTSMGFTPLAGIMMGTRSGDVDPTVVSYMVDKTGKSAADIVNDLNKKSGFLGVSGVSNDFRDIYAAFKDGNERCGLALDMYCKRVVDYIAMYYVELGGADTIVFTAGLGENAAYVKEQICKRLEVLGVKIDNEKTEVRGEEVELSTSDSKIRVFVVPTNEELMMAEDTYNIVFNK